MRRVLFLLMLILGVVTIISGIVEMSPRHTGPPVFHIVVASILAILCIIHLCLNRKAVLRYLTGRR